MSSHLFKFLVTGPCCPGAVSCSCTYRWWRKPVWDVSSRRSAAWSCSTALVGRSPARDATAATTLTSDGTRWSTCMSRIFSFKMETCDQQQTLRYTFCLAGKHICVWAESSHQAGGRAVCPLYSQSQIWYRCLFLWQTNHGAGSHMDAQEGC